MEAPLGVYHFANEIKGKSFQYPSHGGKPDSKQQPIPPQAIGNILNGLDAIGEKQKSNKDNCRNWDSNNPKEVFTNWLFHFGRHRNFLMLLFQISSWQTNCLPQHSNRPGVLQTSLYNKASELTTTICKFSGNNSKSRFHSIFLYRLNGKWEKNRHMFTNSWIYVWKRKKQTLGIYKRCIYQA